MNRYNNWIMFTVFVWVRFKLVVGSSHTQSPVSKSSFFVGVTLSIESNSSMNVPCNTEIPVGPNCVPCLW